MSHNLVKCLTSPQNNHNGFILDFNFRTKLRILKLGNINIYHQSPI